MRQLINVYVDSSDENVVAAVLSRVVSAPVSVNAPVTRIRRGDALSARSIRRTVEEGEVGCHKIRSGFHPHRKLGCEVICNIEREKKKKEIKNSPFINIVSMTV